METNKNQVSIDLSEPNLEALLTARIRIEELYEDLRNKTFVNDKFLNLYSDMREELTIGIGLLIHRQVQIGIEKLKEENGQG